MRLVELAVSDHCGQANFFEDDVTGQNNSLLSDYRGAAGVARSHGMEVGKAKRTVNLTTLDCYLADHSIRPAFLKIDIEGHEYGALAGAESLLSQLPALMVEVTENQEKVSELLRRHGFELSDEHGRSLGTFGPGFGGNVFAIKAPSGRA